MSGLVSDSPLKSGIYLGFEPTMEGSLYTQESNGPGMRKLILEIEPNDRIRRIQRPIFEQMESYNVLEVLRIDFEEGVKIGLTECHTKDNIPIEDIKDQDMIEILSVLKSEGNKHTCVVKVHVPKQFIEEFSRMKMDLIWTTPLSLTKDKRTYSCIGDQQSITKFVEMMRAYGEVVDMRFQRAAYQEHDILSVLTDKQRDVLIKAYKYGYYDYPRRINSEKLAHKVAISKATLLEHMRKAEGRLLSNILAGY